MKQLRKITALILILCTSLYLCTAVYAAEALEIDIDAYAVDDEEFKIFLNHNQGSDFEPSVENVDVAFGAQKMVTNSISRFSDTDEFVSYKCVVDVSGSMDQERIDLAKEMIKSIADNKKDGDNMSITAFGNELIKSDFMVDKEEIKRKADALEVTREDTNLYYCVVEELKALQTDDNVYDKRCLIIFSDGADEQATGITREEAEKATEDSHIPIFTVALLKKNHKTSDEESAKILGSFARLSSGGVHFAPALGDGTVEDIPGRIMGKINNSLILREDLNDVEVSGKEIVLKVSVSPEGEQTASDTINLPEGDVKQIQKAIEELEKEKEAVVSESKAVSEDIVSEPVDEAPAEKTIFGLPAKTVYIVCGILLAVLIIGLIIAAIILTKKTKGYNDEEDDGSDNDSEVTIMGGEASSRTVGVLNGNYTDIPLDASPTVGVTGQASSNASGGPALKVTLTRLGKGEKGTFNINVSGSYPIGRSASKAKLAFKDDTAMSGLHCTLSVRDRNLYITDNGSTNGTFVNGVPISGQFRLQQDDTILMGSYEYRVSWK